MRYINDHQSIMTDYLIVMLISLVRSVSKHFVDSCLLIFINHSLFIFMQQHNNTV